MTRSPALKVYQDHLSEQPPGTLVQIVYSSYAVVGPEADADILRTSQRNNQAAGITGLLVREGNWFMQILEGPVEAVPPLMDRIEADARHRHISIRLVRLVETRRFGDWTMCSPVIDRGGFDALVASLEQTDDVTARIVTGFISDGAWPARLTPQRRLGGALKSRLDGRVAGPFRYIACASLLTEAAAGAPTEAMVDEWWRYNAANDLTGMLVHDDGNLLYYLEGGSDAIARVNGLLAEDPRHAAVVTLLEGETGVRLFGEHPLEVRGKDRPLFPDGHPAGVDPAVLRALSALVRGMR